MKSTTMRIPAITMTVSMVWATSCSFNSFEEKESEEVDCSEVTYSANISTIIEANCAISGCHAGSVSPDFREFNTIQSKSDRIKVRTQNRTMPKNGSLTQQEIDQIACWVDNGALDN